MRTLWSTRGGGGAGACNHACLRVECRGLGVMEACAVAASVAGKVIPAAGELSLAFIGGLLLYFAMLYYCAWLALSLLSLGRPHLSRAHQQ